jgi:hypothetical protein
MCPAGENATRCLQKTVCGADFLRPKTRILKDGAQKVARKTVLKILCLENQIFR